MSPYLTAMQKLFAGSDLDAPSARALIDAMLSGAIEPPRIAAVLSALRMKGLTVDELVAMAEGMRARMLPVPVVVDAQQPLFDVTGSGASGFVPANVHTMVAFVLAAAGVRVAKQIQGGVEGRCGSSDVLEALGIPVALDPERAASLVEQVGIGFLYAPICHPSLHHVGVVRQALGFRTLFNLLGPLCHPAGADHHFVGVGDVVMGVRVAEALARLGSRRVMVVCGVDGRDEVTLGGKSRTWFVSDGFLTEGEIEPEDIGFDRVGKAAVAGGDVGTNRAIVERVLGGDIDCAHGQLVALNAGAALWVAGEVGDVTAGVWMAEELLRTGAAGKMLAAYRAAALSVMAA